MPRILIGVTLIIWVLVGFFFSTALRQPAVFLAPLYGLYPGEMASGASNYHPVLGHFWAAASGLAFIVLAFVGLSSHSKPAALAAAVAFTVLFLLSVLVLFVRVSNVMSQLT
jgi:hypothetical protein